MARTTTAKGLNTAAASELIQHALTVLTNETEAAKAKPAIDAGLELARESSRALGKRTLEITGIVLGTGDLEGGESVITIFNARKPVASGPAKRKPVVAGPDDRIPIAYGGNGYACYLYSYGPPPRYFCIYW